MNHYLCFDAGTQSVKVAVYSAEGECVAKAVNPTTLLYPHPGWVEMDVEEYFQLTLTGMKDCAEQMGRKGLDWRRWGRTSGPARRATRTLCASSPPCTHDGC